MTKTGLCSVSFRKNTPEEIFAAAKSADIQVIEWGSDVHAPHTDTAALEKIAALGERYGIPCSSYGTYFRLGQNDVAELCSYIDAAKILGTSSLRIWCGTKDSEKYSPSERDALVSQCKKAAQIAEARGVTLSCEYHVWNYTDTAQTALEIINEVNSPAFRMYWQPCQFRPFEENLASAKELCDVVTNVHVFNWKGSDKLPLADGADTWVSYLHALGGERTLLLEFMPDDALTSLAAESRALADIIRRMQK